MGFDNHRSVEQTSVYFSKSSCLKSESDINCKRPAVVSIFFQMHILDLPQDFVGGRRGNANQQNLKICFGSGMTHLIIYMILKYILIFRI